MFTSSNRPFATTVSTISALLATGGVVMPALAATPRVDAGGSHTLALKSDGSVWAWGLNTSGQLGDATLTNRTGPVAVSGFGAGSNVVDVFASGDTSFAIESDGSLWGWGSNDKGQLGDGTIINTNTPKEIISSGVAAVSTTKHTVALMADGSVQTWGDNTSGQLGRSTTPSTTPGVVTGLGNDVVAVATGYSFTLALKSDGSVWSMGSHEDGQLGNNITDGSMAQVSNLSGITAITAGTQSGRGFALALKNDGTVFSWGDNSFGQLGNGDATITSSNTPTLIAVLSHVKAIAAGGA